MSKTMCESKERVLQAMRKESIIMELYLGARLGKCGSAGGEKTPAAVRGPNQQRVWPHRAGVRPRDKP